MLLDEPSIDPDASVDFWPVCSLHDEVPVQTIAGWSFCDGVGWHDEDGTVGGFDVDLAVLELSIKRLFHRLNPTVPLLAVV